MTPINPRVKEICRNFSIEDRLMRKLSDVMMRRPDTFDEDLEMLRERLSQPRADIGVLITQLDKGFFVSKGTMAPELENIVFKYKLDDRATQRLVESLRARKKTMLEDLKELDIRLASAERPSGLLMTLLQGLDTNGRLPPPPRSLGLPVSGYDRTRERDRDDDRGKDRRRSKSRSRSRRRR